MPEVIKAILCLAVGTWSALGRAQADGAAWKELQGTWIAVQAQRDGTSAADAVGNHLSFTGSRFEIRSQDGKTLYAGTIKLHPGSEPATIDFEHTEGLVKNETWQGIYELDGDSLTICDDAPDVNRERPAAFEAKKLTACAARSTGGCADCAQSPVGSSGS